MTPPPPTHPDAQTGQSSQGGPESESAGADNQSNAPSEIEVGEGNCPGMEKQIPCADLPLAARIEVLLMTSERPMPTKRLAEMLGLTGGQGSPVSGKEAAAAIKQAIEQLNSQYEDTGRSFRIEEIARGWQMYTIGEYGPLISQVQQQRQSGRLSQAALETLAIIAYRQPILRAEIEAIRGVASGEVLRGLMERRLVKITGRAEELGRPMLYGTTTHFLEVFGLRDLDDLPPVESSSDTTNGAKK